METLLHFKILVYIKNSGINLEFTVNEIIQTSQEYFSKLLVKALYWYLCDGKDSDTRVIVIAGNLDKEIGEDFCRFLINKLKALKISFDPIQEICLELSDVNFEKTIRRKEKE